MSVRVIIDCSWPLVVCTISPKERGVCIWIGKDYYWWPWSLFLFHNHWPQLSKVPNPVTFLKYQTWVKKWYRLQPTSPLITCFSSTPHRINNILQFPLPRKGTDEGSWLENGEEIQGLWCGTLWLWLISHRFALHHMAWHHVCCFLLLFFA